MVLSVQASNAVMNEKKPPLIIPIFIPHSGCPHCCAFCNQSMITGQGKNLPDSGEMDRIIREYLAYKGSRSRVELAFFGGNFLGLSPREILWFLERVRPYISEGRIQGIRCSTRPDTITRRNLDIIASHGVSMIELGVQSMDDAVLSRVGRGHTSDHTRQALDLLKAYAIPTGVQVMIGLPGETGEGVIRGIRELASFQPQTARIYPLLVLKGSRVAKWHAAGTYVPLTLERAVDQAKQLHQIFTRAGVEVIRMGLQASEMMEDKTQVLAGPWHPAFGHLVLSSLFFDRAVSRIRDVRPDRGAMVLRVHPRSESRLRGDKNQTLEKLKKTFPQISFSIETNRDLALDEIEVS
ncbi:elongator complex protein 3 [Desulfospira joergensenii]|uniref:elongator complex protein 3 n=1 Tax=Desulfospira joergensenii TaxID=53329 RepID=UPI0003B7B3EF|nr:radical SAM protein [Desulfospira joergensenii]